MENGGIYQIRCLVNDKVYIGSAKDFSWRWGSHLYDLRKGTHVNPHLQRSFDKHGEINFVFEIVEFLGEYNKELYFERENFYIDQAINSGKFYNIARAEGGWTHHTNERKAEISAKVSKTLKEKYDSMTPKERSEKHGWSKGIHRTEEEKQKISSKMKGIAKSDETKQKMSLAQKSRNDLVEAGRHVGKSNIGRKASNRRKVKVDNQIFDCLKDAAIFLNSSSPALCRAIKHGKFKSHTIEYV
jgi:group I intron endonuclease